MLKFNNVSYSYTKNKLVLDNVSFNVNDNEIAVLLAPNGTGKTTCLKLITSILKPNSGDILYNDESILDMKDIERSKLISYVSQETISLSLSVYEIIMLGRSPYYKFTETKEDIEIVENIIKELGLSEIAFRDFDTLSGGERQIVMIGRALAQSPKILIFDEPTSNLDIKNQILIGNVIKKISKEKNVSVIISTHDINLALNTGDKFIMFKDKTIKYKGGSSIITKESIKDIFDSDVEIKTIDDKKVIIY